jgi:hypothetical protein
MDWQVHASDEAALVGREEHGCRCEIIRGSKPSRTEGARISPGRTQAEQEDPSSRRL